MSEEYTEEYTGITKITDLAEQERFALRALAEEFEGAQNTQASVSRELARSATKDERPDAYSRVAALLDPQYAADAEGGAVDHLGPWDARIGFPDGIAVGGWANLALHRNGAYNFSGHFHVSGAISYNCSLAWAVRDSRVPATVYLFATQGRLHGTFEAGSRDHDWNKAEINPALAQGWDALVQRWNWQWNARVNADFGVFLDDIVKVVAAGQAVANVIKIFA